MEISSREKVFLGGGAAALALLALILGVILPYRGAVASLEKEIEGRRRDIARMETLAKEYRALQLQVNQIEATLNRSAGFSLFSFVENVTAQVATKEKLVYMRPQPPATLGDIREESVEIKIEKIGLDQLVRLLYAIDTAEAYLKVKTMRVKTRFEDPSQLDVVMTVAAYGRVR